MKDGRRGAQKSAMCSLFTRIAKIYDPLNRLLTGGIDILWRRRAIARLAAAWGQSPATEGGQTPATEGGQSPKRLRILDLATGTADLAIGLAKRFPQAEVVGVDLTPAMLEIGARKVVRAGLSASCRGGQSPADGGLSPRVTPVDRGLSPRVTPADGGLSPRVRLEEGDAEKLAFEDKSFDIVTCAFGFRNFPDRERALSEVTRVLKPQGLLLVLELLRRDRSIFAFFTTCWLKALCGIFVRRAQRGDYAYLRASIASAPSAEEFVRMANEAGLTCRRDDFFRPSCACLLFQKRT